MRCKVMQLIREQIKLTMDIFEITVLIRVLLSKLFTFLFMMRMDVSHGSKVFRRAVDIDIKVLIRLGCDELQF